MHQATKQFQTAKSTLQLIANNPEEILEQMEVAVNTNLDNLQLYFENLKDIYSDIGDLKFDSKLDDILTLRAELTDFLGCFADNILYYNPHQKIKHQAAALRESVDEHLEELEELSEYDARANLKTLEKYREAYTDLSKLILKSRTRPAITAVTIYRSLVNVFENFFVGLADSIEKDASIYDIIQYMTILDALRYYYVDSVSTHSFYTVLLNTKVTADINDIKACLENTDKLERYDFDKTLQDLKTYQVYLDSLKDECEF